MVSSCETELTLPQLTGPVADSQMECMHHSLPIQRLFNTVCLEPAFLLKLFWLRNYPDESTAKLCALTGIFKVGLELLHSKMGSVRDDFFWRISLKPKVWFCFVHFYFIYFYIGSVQLMCACIIICKTTVPFFLNVFTVCVKIIQ